MIVAGPHVDRAHAPAEKWSPRPMMHEHIHAAIATAQDEDFRVGAVGFFASNPRGRNITLHPDEREPLREYLKSEDIFTLAHSSFTSQPWKGDPSAAAFIRQERAVCASAGARGLVVHLPHAALDSVVKYLPRLTDPTEKQVPLYLETPAVKPKESHYHTPENLAALFRAAKDINICIDTAHLWACGVDLGDYAAANGWFTALEALSDAIPHSAVALHLNDSSQPRGSGRDVHAGLCRGLIWGDYADRPQLSGLNAVLEYAARHSTPIVLERKPAEALRLDYQVLGLLART